MKNEFLEKIKKGQKTVGTFLEFGDQGVAEALALTDLDYMLIDTEHGPFDVETVMTMIRAAELHGTTPFVRVKDSNRNSILKMLDVGAQGLIIPQVHSIEEIKKIVEYGKYFPVGSRGVAFARGCGFGYKDYTKGDINDYFAYCNRETLLIPQCETQGCLDDIENIAKVDGIDGIFVGPYDLSVAMGIPTQFDKPEFKDALKRILAAVEEAGKFTIIYCANTDVANERLAQGFNSVTIGQDVNFYVDAINEMYHKVNKD